MVAHISAEVAFIARFGSAVNRNELWGVVYSPSGIISTYDGHIRSDARSLSLQILYIKMLVEAPKIARIPQKVGQIGMAADQG